MKIQPVKQTGRGKNRQAGRAASSVEGETTPLAIIFSSAL